MRRLVAAIVLGILIITACTPPSTPSSPDPTPNPAPTNPAPGIPECLYVPNTSRAGALPLVLGETISIVTGELWYEVNLEPGTYTFAFNKLPPYIGFFYGLYQGTTFAPVQSLFTDDYQTFIRDTFEIDGGETVIRLFHINSDYNCETYNVTLVRGKP